MEEDLEGSLDSFLIGLHMDIPLSPSSITTEWLTEVLGQSKPFEGTIVTNIEVTDIGEGTGIFGEIALLSLTFAENAIAPTSIVVKMPCIEPENLMVAQALGIYEREMNFFESIAPSTNLRIPNCYFSHMEEDGRFIILMENLSEEFSVGDQVIGASNIQVESAITTLAEFHTEWWENPTLLTLDWLPKQNDPAYLAAVPGIFRAGLPILISDWADRIPAESIEIAKKLDPRFEELMDAFAAGPYTFAHSDTRLDNWFFANDDSGNVALIDFQLCSKARGVNDIAYLIGTSVPRELAAENWERYLRLWWDSISEQNISYSWDDAVRHYQLASLYYTVGGMSLIGSFDTGNERGAAMAEAYVTRTFSHIVDIDAASAFNL